MKTQTETLLWIAADAALPNDSRQVLATTRNVRGFRVEMLTYGDGAWYDEDHLPAERDHAHVVAWADMPTGWRRIEIDRMPLGAHTFDRDGILIRYDPTA